MGNLRILKYFFNFLSFIFFLSYGNFAIAHSEQASIFTGKVIKCHEINELDARRSCFKNRSAFLTGLSDEKCSEKFNVNQILKNRAYYRLSDPIDLTHEIDSVVEQQSKCQAIKLINLGLNCDSLPSLLDIDTLNSLPSLENAYPTLTYTSRLPFSQDATRLCNEIADSRYLNQSTFSSQLNYIAFAEAIELANKTPNAYSILEPLSSKLFPSQNRETAASLNNNFNQAPKQNKTEDDSLTSILRRRRNSFIESNCLRKDPLSLSRCQIIEKIDLITPVSKINIQGKLKILKSKSRQESQLKLPDIHEKKSSRTAKNKSSSVKSKSRNRSKPYLKNLRSLKTKQKNRNTKTKKKQKTYFPSLRKNGVTAQQKENSPGYSTYEEWMEYQKNYERNKKNPRGKNFQF